MEEKMKVLEEKLVEVSTYCTENKIEYLFAAVAEEGKHTLLSHNMITNAIMKEATKVIEAFVRK